MHNNRIAIVVSLVLSTGVYGAEAAGPEERELGHVKTLNGHLLGVLSVAWSPNGQRLASGSGDNTIKVWDPESGQELRTLTGHGDLFEGWVSSVAWSPNGQRLASGSVDKTIKVWDPESGQELRTLTGHGGWVWSVAWSPNGQRLASASGDRTVRIWEKKSSQEPFPQAVKEEKKQDTTPLQPCPASAPAHIEEGPPQEQELEAEPNDDQSSSSASSPSSSTYVHVDQSTTINETYCCKCSDWVVKIMCCFGCCKNLRKSCNKCNPLRLGVC